MLLQQVGQPPDDLAPDRRGDRTPRPILERPPRGADGAVDVLGLTVRDVGDLLLGGRVGRHEGFAGGGLDPLPIDEQAACGADEVSGGLAYFNCNSHWPLLILAKPGLPPWRESRRPVILALGLFVDNGH